MMTGKAQRLLREAQLWAERRAQRRPLAVALVIYGLAAAGLCTVVALKRAPSVASSDTPDDLHYEVRAVDAVLPMMDRQGFHLRFVDCRRLYEAGRACAVCSTGPHGILGSALVYCEEKRCTWPMGGDLEAQAAFEEAAGWVPDDCIEREE